MSDIQAKLYWLAAEYPKGAKIAYETVSEIDRLKDINAGLLNELESVRDSAAWSTFTKREQQDIEAIIAKAKPMSDSDKPLYVETTVDINKDNLPEGHWFEIDGAAWKAVTCNPNVYGREWRWEPLNFKAHENKEPRSKMTNFLMPL